MTLANSVIPKLLNPMLIKTRLSIWALILFSAAPGVRANTFTVSSTSDFPVSGGSSVNTATGVISGGAGNGQITLRSAVIAANANAGSTIIIPAGTYQITMHGGVNEGNVDPDPTVGTLSVLASVTIQGAGPGNTIIQAGTSLANSIDQILVLNAYYWSTGQSAVVNNFKAVISGITFQYGKCFNTNTQSGNYVGGAISFDAGYNNGAGITPGSLLVSNCVFNSCMSHWAGGAIGTFDGGTQTYVNCIFTNNNANSDLFSSGSGGAMVIGNTTVNPGAITISNCTFVNNQALTGAGGAIVFEGGNPAYAIHNCVFSGNAAGGYGGGIYSLANNLTIDQGTLFTNNSSLGSVITTAQGTGTGPTQLAASGGGVYISSGPDLISNCVFVANVVSTSSADQRGGGGISLSGLTIPGPGGSTLTTNATVVDCRIYGNIANSGSGLSKDNNAGNAIAINNWWGNNGGPGIGGADTVVRNTLGSGGGVLITNTWLVLGLTASASTILTGQNSTLTATITKNSANGTGFTVPNGTPITFGGTLGTDSPASTTFAGGTATSTFTAGSIGGSGNAVASVDAQSLNTPIQVNQPPAITSANTATFLVGSNGSFQVTRAGVPVPSVSETGTLPSGVTFTSSNDVLSGPPAAGTGGTYPVIFTAMSAAGTNTQSFTLTVNQPPAITNANSTTFVAGTSGSFKIGATGFPVPVLSESGTLPSGVTFVPATGILSGTNGVASGGIYPLVFTAANAAGTNTQNFTLTVNQAPTVNCPASMVTNALGGVCLLPSVSFAATAAGFPAPGITYKLGASAITSPTVFPIGTNVVNVTAANSAGTNTCSFTVTVQPGPEPRLNVVWGGGKVVVSWSNSYNCYTLQFAPLLKSNSWSNLIGPFTTNSGVIYMTNNNSASAGFFRLFH